MAIGVNSNKSNSMNIVIKPLFIFSSLNMLYYDFMTTTKYNT